MEVFFPAAGAPAFDRQPLMSSNSLEADFPMLLDILGEGLNDIFDSETTHQQLQQHNFHQLVETLPPTAPQQQQQGQSPFMAGADTPGVFVKRQSESHSRSSSHGTTAPYEQLVQLQQQLQALQSSVDAQLQSLQQQQDGALNGQDVQSMQQMLLRMQGLLEQSQHQQHSQHLVHAPSNPCIANSSHLHEATQEFRWPPLQLPQQHHQLQTFSSQPAAQQQEQVAQPQQQRSTRPAGTALTGEASKRQKGGKNAVAELERQLEAKQAEAEAWTQKNEALKRRQRMLGHFIKVREDQMRRLSELKADKAFTFAAKPHSPFGLLSIEQLRDMDLATSNALYGQVVQEVSRLLGMSSGPPSSSLALVPAKAQPSPAAAGTQPELEVLIKYMTEVSQLMMFLNPSFHKIRYESSANSAPVPAQHWQQVLAACALDEEQVLNICVLHDIHRNLTNKVYKERAGLASELQQLLAGAVTYVTTSVGSLASANGLMLHDRLRRNLVQERCILFLTGEVFNEMLSVPQVAHVAVASYPHKPDELALIHEIAKLRRLHAPAGAV